MVTVTRPVTDPASAVLCWWEKFPIDGQMDPMTHAATIAQAQAVGYYRADRGACAEPVAADLPGLFDLCEGLRERLSRGRAVLARKPDNPRAQLYMTLLTADLEASLAAFQAALANYEKAQDFSAHEAGQ